MRIVLIIILLIIIVSISIYGFNLLNNYSKDIYVQLELLENQVIENKWNQGQKKIALMIDHADFHDLNIRLTSINSLLNQREKNELLTEISIAKELAFQLSEQARFSLQNIF